MSDGPYTYTFTNPDATFDPIDPRYQFPVEFGMMKNIPFQYDFDVFGAPKAKLGRDGRITFTGPVVRPTFKEGKREGEYRPKGIQQTVRYNPNELGATIKTINTPLIRNRRRAFTEDFDSKKQFNERNRFSRLRDKGYGDLKSSIGYKKVLDPDTEPYRLHLPVTGELPELITRYGSHMAKGMQLGSIYGGGFETVVGERAPLSQRLLGVGRLNPNVDIDYSKSTFANRNDIPGLVGGFGGFLSAGISMMGAAGSEQSYLNLPIKGRFTRNKILNTIFPGFEDYAAKGNDGTGFSTTTGTGSGSSVFGVGFGSGKTFSRASKNFGLDYENPNYSRQTQSKIHPLIPFTGRYTIGGDDKGEPDYSGNIFKDIGEYVYRGGLDRNLRKVGFPYGASFETPLPLLPPRMNIFDPGRFGVTRTTEEIYNPQLLSEDGLYSGASYKHPRYLGNVTEFESGPKRNFFRPFRIFNKK